MKPVSSRLLVSRECFAGRMFVTPVLRQTCHYIDEGHRILNDMLCYQQTRSYLLSALITKSLPKCDLRQVQCHGTARRRFLNWAIRPPL